MSRVIESIGCFEPTFIEAHQASKMICNVRSLKSRIKTGSFSEHVITSSNNVFGEFVFDIGVGNGTLRNSTWFTVKGYVIVK
jgi:hypothetical protein